MRKYLYSFKLFFLSAMQYRFNTFVSLLFTNLRLLITVLFWVLIYGGDTGRELSGFTLPGVITYMVFMEIFGGLIYALRNSGFDYSAMIKSGALGPALLKPYNLNTSLYFRNLSSSLPGLLPQIVLVLCVLPWAGGYMVFEVSLLNTLSIALFLLAGTWSAHLLCSLLGYMAFWLEEANAVMWSFMVLLNMMMGMFLPIDFFPRWSVPLIEMLPTSAWGYLQTKILIGMYNPGRQAMLLMVQIGWIGALLGLNALVWRRGVRKFSSVGG